MTARSGCAIITFQTGPEPGGSACSATSPTVWGPCCARPQRTTPPSDWLITPGRASVAVDQALAGQPPGPGCRQARLPRLTQRDYDRLLWSCDLNFVRGEDSLVRALWAGKPFVWHIYPQHDEAHHAKLDAFLDWLQAPPSWRTFHHDWNGMTATQPVWPGWRTIDEWTACAQRARQRLLAQTDLCAQLLGFVMEKR